MPDTALAIELHDLRFSYPDGTLALDGISLSVEPGRRLGLIGPNGAGKSTLLLHLNGLLRGEGEVSILGLPVRAANLRAIRQHVGLVFQNPDDQLFMPTVFDEVAYAAVNAGYSREEVRQRVARALATAGMSGYEEKHPANLSMGQKKRIAIASVLVTDNEILALDEPSAGLDPAGRRALIELLDSFESTMLIATHDLALVEALCDTAAVMTSGAIVRVAPLSEVLGDTAFLEACGL